MGLVEWFFGLRDLKAQWNHYDDDTRVKKLIVPILEQVATAVGSPTIARNDEGVELWGTIGGYASRVQISTSGGIEVVLRYEEDQPLLVLDAKAEGVSSLRLHDGELNIRFDAQIYALADPARRLIDALALGRDILVGRGATPSPLPSSPVDPNEPLRGYRHLDKAQKQARRLFLAESIAKRVGGRAHSVREHDTVRVDVQWTENEEELRIDIVSSGEIYPSAGAEGIPGEFMLWHERDLDEEAPMLRALPDELLRELFAVKERRQVLYVELDQGSLYGQINKGLGDGTGAIEAARTLAKVVRALRGGPPT